MIAVSESNDPRAAQVEQTICAFLEQLMWDREVRPVPEITSATVLYDVGDTDDETLGLDSVDALDLISELESTYELAIPADVDFTSVRTVGDVVALVVSFIP